MSRGQTEVDIQRLQSELARLQEEHQQRRRRPATLTLKWRIRGTGWAGSSTGWARSSASTAMPLSSQALAQQGGSAEAVQQLVAAAEKLLAKHLGAEFNLSLLNLGATNFKEEGAAGAAGGIARFLVPAAADGKAAASASGCDAAAGGTAAGAAAARRKCIPIDEEIWRRCKCEKWKSGLSIPLPSIGRRPAGHPFRPTKTS